PSLSRLGSLLARRPSSPAVRDRGASGPFARTARHPKQSDLNRHVWAASRAQSGVFANRLPGSEDRLHAWVPSCTAPFCLLLFRWLLPLPSRSGPYLFPH